MINACPDNGPAVDAAGNSVAVAWWTRAYNITQGADRFLARRGGYVRTRNPRGRRESGGPGNGCSASRIAGGGCRLAGGGPGVGAVCGFEWCQRSSRRSGIFAATLPAAQTARRGQRRGCCVDIQSRGYNTRGVFTVRPVNLPHAAGGSSAREWGHGLFNPFSPACEPGEPFRHGCPSRESREIPRTERCAAAARRLRGGRSPDSRADHR